MLIILVVVKLPLNREARGGASGKAHCGFCCTRVKHSIANIWDAELFVNHWYARGNQTKTTLISIVLRSLPKNTRDDDLLHHSASTVTYLVHC
jgi:hypothetical protein